MEKGSIQGMLGVLSLDWNKEKPDFIRIRSMVAKLHLNQQIRVTKFPLTTCWLKCRIKANRFSKIKNPHDNIQQVWNIYNQLKMTLLRKLTWTLMTSHCKKLKHQQPSSDRPILVILRLGDILAPREQLFLPKSVLPSINKLINA